MCYITHLFITSTPTPTKKTSLPAIKTLLPTAIIKSTAKTASYPPNITTLAQQQRQQVQQSWKFRHQPRPFAAQLGPLAEQRRASAQQIEIYVSELPYMIDENTAL